ncbi:hypothetical protein [Tunicatimonas pelagia]|uniref:hypothetical protein n=1 Tax=Tunicatimonas pelagia TaxID=931531 RepID=UPI002666804A|nr:hypothetical protein [Tunicatimonas pelagia]WKN45413.1 hypothetical protein P0M28_10635 [Tunicatimonas pelagia]
MEATKDYIKGFNNGYLFSRYANELADTVIDKLDSSQDYVQGLKDGKQQYEQELDKEIARWSEKHKNMQDQSRRPDAEKKPENPKEKGPSYDMD